MQTTTKTFLQYCLHGTRFLHSGLAAQLPFTSLLQKQTASSCLFSSPHMFMKHGAVPHEHAVICCLQVDSSFTTCECHTVLHVPPPSWSFAAVSLLSVQTARWRTFLRWTGHILPWSPVCSIAGRCDICFHSAWNRSATGLWPCYRLQGETGLEEKEQTMRSGSPVLT